MCIRDRLTTICIMHSPAVLREELAFIFSQLQQTQILSHFLTQWFSHLVTHSLAQSLRHTNQHLSLQHPSNNPRWWKNGYPNDPICPSASHEVHQLVFFPAGTFSDTKPPLQSDSQSLDLNQLSTALSQGNLSKSGRQQNPAPCISGRCQCLLGLSNLGVWHLQKDILTSLDCQSTGKSTIYFIHFINSRFRLSGQRVPSFLS
eukprot:TRINITY_DN2728_c0_g4_i1.p1 TRINITY_DN2728_c0_g4~~TRINITY_DN2728_c0_g4_i1.p1  ORF type:complete len:213 (+),score=-28.60 TRINITY_DN2728_c0_g4_i1:31-639(+)